MPPPGDAVRTVPRGDYTEAARCYRVAWGDERHARHVDLGVGCAKGLGRAGLRALAACCLEAAVAAAGGCL